MEANRQWTLRPGQQFISPERLYGRGNRSLFSVKVCHHGIFSLRPNRQYIGGLVQYIDFLNVDRLYIEDLHEIVEVLGHEPPFFIYWLKSGETLDFGLKRLKTSYDLDGFLLDVVKGMPDVQTLYIDHYVPSVHEFYPKTLKKAPATKVSQLLKPLVDENMKASLYEARRFVFEKYRVWLEKDLVEEGLGLAVDEKVGFKYDSN